MAYIVDVAKELEDIKLTPYGKTMRPALHSSIDKLSKRHNQLGSTIESLIIDAGQNNAEVVAARVDANNPPTIHASLKDRLDSDIQEVIDARTDANVPPNTYPTLKDRLDADAKEVIDARTDADGNTYLTLGDRLNHIDEEINNLDIKIDEIALIMPPPATVAENTAKFQEYLDIAKHPNAPNILIKFRKGEYELNTCTIYSNTHVQLTNETSIRHIQNQVVNPDTGQMVNVAGLFYNSKPFDVEDAKITGYSGRSNIKFEGGTIYGICPFILNHGQNIEISNVTFRETRSDHAMQIAACKNVTIRNCEFYGTRAPSANRNYVEMIQIDWMTEPAQPYWPATGAIFDSTINDGIYIDSCKFFKGQGTYANFKAGVGAHGTDGANKNKNIVIKNCEFNDFEYAGVSIHNMDGVVLDNNVFITSVTGTNGIRITGSDNVDVLSTNIIMGGQRGIFCTTGQSVFIGAITIKDVNATSDYLLIGECENISVDGAIFLNCKGGNSHVLVRNCKNTSVINCKDINSDAGRGSFCHVYINNNGVNERITVLNNITDKEEISLISADSIICNLDETLWTGTANNGSLTLRDDMSKFKDLRIYANMYGIVSTPMEFVNDKLILRDINLNDQLADTSEGKRLHFVEIFLERINNRQIDIRFLGAVQVQDGVHTLPVHSVVINRIVGKRVRF